MEAKKAAIVAVCVLLLLTLPGQQQVAASARSEFCACYKECYPGCRHHVSRFGCMLFCANKCSPSQAAAVDSCRAHCAGIRICGLSDPSADAPDAAACVQNCNEKWSHGPTQ
ncbi:unnamed protein product [Alopecurus aequalis]